MCEPPAATLADGSRPSRSRPPQRDLQQVHHWSCVAFHAITAGLQPGLTVEAAQRQFMAGCVRQMLHPNAKRTAVTLPERMDRVQFAMIVRKALDKRAPPQSHKISLAGKIAESLVQRLLNETRATEQRAFLCELTGP